MAYRYPVIRTETGNNYTFKSIGPNGKFTQILSFVPFKIDEESPKTDYYMLGFGITAEEFYFSGIHVDDKALINNGDVLRILNTVANCLVDFLNQNPNEIVYFEGSTEKRMRLYLSIIRHRWSSIESLFELYGVIGENWEKFDLDSNKQYSGLYFRKKV